MSRSFLLIFFICLFGSTCIAQENSAQVNLIDIERLAEFALNQYGISIAHSEELKEIEQISLIEGDRAGFLSQFNSHPIYEMKMMGKEMLLRVADRISQNRSFKIKVISAVDQSPIELAAVALSNTSVGDYTDSNGELKLEVPSHFQNESLEIQMMGFERQVININKIDATHTFTLTPLAIDVDEVIVEDKVSAVNSSIDEHSMSLDPEAQLLSSGNIAGADVLRSVQVLPGVASFEDNSAGIQIRGSTYDQTMIRMDGIPIYNASHYFGIFSNLNPLYVNSVTAYKNNLPIEVGGKNGGLIDVYSSRDTALSKLEGKVDLNLLSSAVMIKIPIVENLQLSLAGRSTIGNVNNKGFFNLFSDQSTDGSIVQNFGERARAAILGATPDFSFYDLHAGTTYRLSKHLSLKANYFQSSDELSQNTVTTFLERRRINNFQNEERYSHKEQWKNLGYNFRIDYDASEDLNVNASAYHSRYEKSSITEISLSRNMRTGVQQSRQRFRSTNFIEETGFKFNVNYQVARETIINTGLDLVNYKAKINNSDEAAERLKLDRTADEIVPYVEVSHSLPKDWNVSIGSRLSKYSITGDWYSSPRISLTKKVNDNINLKSSIGRQYQFARMLDFENVNRRSLELWALGGTPNIPVSVVDNFMLGAQYNMGRFNFDIELYQRLTDGVLNIALRNPQFNTNTIAPDIITDGYANYTGTGKTIGADFMITYTGRKYGFYTAYTLSKSTESFRQIARGEELPAQLDRRHQLTVAQTYDFGDWFVGTDINWASGKPYLDLDKVEANQDRLNLGGQRNYSLLPDYARLDFGVGYKLKIGKKELSLKASLVNALDRQNVTYLQYTFALPPAADTNAGTRGTNLGSTTNLINRTLNLSARLSF